MFYVLGCDEVILLDGFDFLCNAISMRSTISIFVTVGNFFVFFLHLSASNFHCFFFACIIYNFVILVLWSHFILEIY